MPVSFLVGRARETDSICLTLWRKKNARVSICNLCKYQVCKFNNEAGRGHTSRVPFYQCYEIFGHFFVRGHIM